MYGESTEGGDNKLKTMNNKLKDKGFSLTEILLAVGTLGIGMLFISGTFLAGIHLSTISAEQTIAAVAADEAFAKIKLYGINPGSLANDQLQSYESVKPIDPNEFAYPSTMNGSQKQYYWSALCRRAGSNTSTRLVQVTIFISRKIADAASYRGGKGIPVPMQVGISGITGSNQLTITEADKISWINDGYTIVDDKTGEIYRVIERNTDQPNTIRLNRNWQGSLTASVWVVPPPSGGGKNPNIAVYQKLIRF